jgi:hypothetical protein
MHNEHDANQAMLAAAEESARVINTLRTGRRQITVKEYELDLARMLQRSRGTYGAAAYMRQRGWSLEAALHHLAGKPDGH